MLTSGATQQVFFAMATKTMTTKLIENSTSDDHLFSTLEKYIELFSFTSFDTIHHVLLYGDQHFMVKCGASELQYSTFKN